MASFIAWNKSICILTPARTEVHYRFLNLINDEIWPPMVVDGMVVDGSVDGSVDGIVDGIVTPVALANPDIKLTARDLVWVDMTGSKVNFKLNEAQIIDLDVLDLTK